MNPIIEISNLTKYFGNIIALQNVDLRILPGELFCLLGPNGAGKTTLIKILSTLILPTEGKAKVNNYDILKEPIEVKKSIGLVNSEERSFYWQLNGEENLKFFTTLYNLPAKKINQRIDEIFTLFEMENLPKVKYKNYSAGIKQKFNFFRALIPDPPILLIDELTKSIDPESAANLRIFIKEKLVKEQGKTVLLATHNLEEVEEIADRLAIIDSGRIIACGTINELKKQYQTENLPEIYRVLIRNSKSIIDV